MNISEWLDRKEAEGADLSQITLPETMTFDNPPDETVYFKQYRPCSVLCSGNHPFSTVERYGRWYHARGQDKKAGIHRKGMEWSLFTKDKDLAIKTAQSHIE